MQNRLSSVSFGWRRVGLLWEKMFSRFICQSFFAYFEAEGKVASRVSCFRFPGKAFVCVPYFVVARSVVERVTQATPCCSAELYRVLLSFGCSLMRRSCWSVTVGLCSAGGRLNGCPIGWSGEDLAEECLLSPGIPCVLLSRRAEFSR